MTSKPRREKYPQDSTKVEDEPPRTPRRSLSRLLPSSGRCSGKCRSRRSPRICARNPSGRANDRNDVAGIAKRVRFLPDPTVERTGKVLDQDQDAPQRATAKKFLRPGDHRHIRLYALSTPGPSQMRPRIGSKLATCGAMGSLSSHEIDRRKEEPAKTQFAKQAYPDLVSLVNTPVVGQRDSLGLIEYFCKRRL